MLRVKTSTSSIKTEGVTWKTKEYRKREPEGMMIVTGRPVAFSTCRKKSKIWCKYPGTSISSDSTHLWKELRADLVLIKLQKEHFKVQIRPCSGNNQGDFRVMCVFFWFPLADFPYLTVECMSRRPRKMGGYKGGGTQHRKTLLLTRLSEREDEAHI